MKKIFTLIIALGFASASFGQGYFTDAAAAMQSPGDVLELDLSNQEISQLPEGIGKMLNLGTLRLNGTSIPASELKKLAALPKLRKLYMPRMGFAEWPAELNALKGLTTIDISKNPIGKLPAEIGGFAALEELKAKECGLTALPEELSALGKLTKLDISYNYPMTEFPAVILKCNGLEELDLRNTNIKALPAEIVSLRKLSYFGLPMLDTETFEKLKHRFPNTRLVRI